MKANATIIIDDGSKVSLDVWQQIYALPRGTSKIGRHFTIGEKSFLNGLEIAADVIKVLDLTRELKGEALSINSLDRSKFKQDQLIRDGYRAAARSPHVAKMAGDIDTVSADDTHRTVALLKEAAKKLGITIRIGWEDYLKNGQTFVHFDVCPMFYGPGKPYVTMDAPEPWRRACEW